jgi:spermidine synthase
LIAAARYRFDSDAMAGKKPRFMFLEEGKAGVISVVTYDEKKARLQNNGIQESYLGLVPTIKPPFTEVLLGLMPFLLHPDPKSAFVVGFGGGNTVQALADTPLQEIRVVELEPAVISAVAAIRDGEIPILQDSRVQLRLNDARNSLLVEGRSYDLIVSQPSHPWLAGAGNLFTRQFFEIAAARLNDGGIFAQWVNLFNMDATTLRSILQAYFQVFPHGFTFVNKTPGDLLLFGSKQPLVFDYRRIEKRMRMPRIKRALAAAKVRRPEALLWYFALSRAEALTAAADMPPNTDTRIYSEVRLVHEGRSPG